MFGEKLARLSFLEPLVHYKKEYFKYDVTAALTVTLLAVPQGMAYALIAGLDPVIGLYSSIICRILGSLFGSSNHVVTGPTNAIALLVAAYMNPFFGHPDFYQMLFLLTFLIGLIQFCMGALKLGNLVNYVAHSVIVGFTAGAGVIIALGQVNELLGIHLPAGHFSTLSKVIITAYSLDQINYYALGLGLLTIATVVAARLINKKLPGALLGLVTSALAVALFGLDQHGIKLMGQIPSAIPPLTMLHPTASAVENLMSGALVIAIIGLVEAMSIAKAISSQTLQKIDANQEFIGQGMANMGGALFSCMPASGSFTRSSVNFQSGAKTKLSGILSGFIMLLALIFCARYIVFIPGASLAGLIMVVAYSMINFRALLRVIKCNRNDAIILWVTFLTTIFAEHLEYAIYAGLVVSIILFLKETSAVHIKLFVPDGNGDEPFNEYEIDWAYLDGKTPRTVIVAFVGSLYFGSAADLEAKLGDIYEHAASFVLRFNSMSAIDITSLEVLENFITRAVREDKKVALYGVRPELMIMLIRSNILGHVGEENVFTPEDEMLATSCQIDVCYQMQERASQRKEANLQTIEKATRRLSPSTLLDFVKDAGRSNTK
ncbi:MAG: SulP family inorganic anion transporter [Negativicutes bacterium]|nr:SulP family inorganic anion transporter [Negativicutes bacterium]MDR3592861.1 SulP family inorganic anion transporter [Negativicutes bacterium]